MSGGFDRVASSYVWLERLVFGSRLQRCRVACIDALRGARSILVLGEGDGRFLVELVRVCPDARVTVVEASARMAALAQARIRRTGPSVSTDFVIGDALHVALPEASYDAIVCNFFLDCFAPAELDRILARIDGWFAPHGVLLLGEFVPASRPLGKVSGAILSPLMHAFFRVTAGIKARRLQDLPAALAARGFERTRSVEALGGFLQSSAWALAPRSPDV